MDINDASGIHFHTNNPVKSNAMGCRRGSMPTLQVRNLPEDVYIRLSMIAKEENRSIAQQTIVLLRESLGLPANNKLRRQALLETIREKTYPDTSAVDEVAWIREDRGR
jgi:antitoxin FitA